MILKKKITIPFIGFVSLTALLTLLAFYDEETLIDDYLLRLLVGQSFLSDVYIMDSDGKVKNLSPSKNGIYYQPHINHSGTKVVFFGNEEGSPQIWIADVESGKAVPLTEKNSGARHPVFSWDDKMIAFSSDRAFTQEPEKIEFMHRGGLPPKNHFINIYVMDSDGGNVRQVTFGPYQDQRPGFSPDGKTIAFVSNRSGAGGLWG